MDHNIPPLGAGALVGAQASPHYVQRRTQDGIAVLTVAGPDGNRLGPDLVAALARAFHSALSDDGVRAMVLTARGPDFCAGPWTDLPPPGPKPLDAPPVLADLADLCGQIERSAKPVVCALHGRVASGGLALALAARARIADTRATLHFPEIRLGRLPPGNAATRLAWWLGAATAFRLLFATAPQPVTGYVAPGLCDLADGDGTGLLPGVIALAASLAGLPEPDGGAGPPGLSDAVGFRAAIGQKRQSLPHPLPRHRLQESVLIDVVEAAQLLPPEQALAYDLMRAQDAAQAPEARALAHLARATRRALDTPESQAIPRTPRLSPLVAALSPQNAARLMPPLLRSGAQAVMIAAERDPLAAALEAVAEAQMDQIRKGRLTKTQAEDDWARISGRLSIDPAHPPAFAFADAEHADWLAGQLGPTLARACWSPGTRNPDTHGLGMVTLVPAPSRAPRLCEVIVQADSNADAVQQATQLVLRLKLSPVRVAGAPMAPVLSDTLTRTARSLRARGVTARMLEATGIMPTGLALGDAADSGAELPHSVDRLILLAVVNAGAALLAAGRCLRPSDLDLVAVLGVGWPNWRGGPMAEADAIGPMVLRQELRDAAALDAELWTPHPLFDTLIRDGRRFEDLNTAPPYQPQPQNPKQPATAPQPVS